MSSNLTKIQGIGPSAAKQLTQAGFETIENVANAAPTELGKVQGFGSARSQQIIAAAKEVLEIGGAPAPDATTDTINDKPEASPVIAALTSSRLQAFREPTVLIPVAAVVFLSVLAFGKSETANVLYNTVSSTSHSIIAEMSDIMGMKPDVTTIKQNVALTDQVTGVADLTPTTRTTDTTNLVSAPSATQQAGVGYYPGYGYAAYSPWNNQYNGNGNGNAWGNGNAGFSMGFNGHSNVAGQGYGYNNPYYYGTPYGYAPYGYPYPVTSHQASIHPDTTR